MEQLRMWLDVDKGKHIHVGSPSVTEAAEVPQGEMELSGSVPTFLDQPETQEIQAAPGSASLITGYLLCTQLSKPTPGFPNVLCMPHTYPCLCVPSAVNALNHHHFPRLSSR